MHSREMSPTSGPEIASTYGISLLPAKRGNFKMAAMGVIILLLAAVVHLCEASLFNIALQKPVNVSSKYHNRDPALAVDGDTNTCMHTEAQPRAWWTVDLQQDVQDATVEIYFRIDNKERRNGVQLYTSNAPFSSYPDGHLCHTVTGDPFGTDIPDVVHVTCPGTWRYAMVYTSTANHPYGPLLDFAEVMVLACTARTYGEKCDKPCGQCAVNYTLCDRNSGHCPMGCQSGWRGKDCTEECLTGTYGQNCAKSCSYRYCAVPSDSCDRYIGACPAGGCQNGWMGIDCTEVCPVGTYGHNCVKSCSFRQCAVTTTPCDRLTGSCLTGGCMPGWVGIDCTQSCDGTYGVNCSKSCFSRQCAVTPTSCDSHGGACPTGGCKPGWMGTDCAQECLTGTYGQNCAKSCSSRQCAVSSDSCDRYIGACPTGGCQDGWMGTDCTKVVTCGRSSAYVIGSVIGAFVTVSVIGGIYACLLKRGRMQWINTPGSDVSTQPTAISTTSQHTTSEWPSAVCLLSI